MPGEPGFARPEVVIRRSLMGRRDACRGAWARFEACCSVQLSYGRIQEIKRLPETRHADKPGGADRRRQIRVARTPSTALALQDGTPRRLILEGDTAPPPNVLPCFGDPANEFGMMLQAIIEPVLLALETNEHTRRPAMAGDADGREAALRRPVMTSEARNLVPLDREPCEQNHHGHARGEDGERNGRFEERADGVADDACRPRTRSRKIARIGGIDRGAGATPQSPACTGRMPACAEFSTGGAGRRIGRAPRRYRVVPKNSRIKAWVRPGCSNCGT